MLSYASVKEAEVALGRSLTVAETLWFNYSGSKSDYFLYCHNIIFLLLIYTLAPLPLVFMDLIKGFHRYKIQTRVKLSLSEMFDCYFTVIKTFGLLLIPLMSSYYPVKMTGIQTGLPLPSGWEILAQLIVYFLIEDYTNYWIHRLILHSKWGYEKIHRVHHEYSAPIGFAAPYAHWLEILILGLPSFLGPAIAPGHMVTYWLWMVLRQIESIDTHSGYDLPWTPTKYIPFYGGADHHDYHHFVGGQSQNNFASVFTFCDYIYGTDKGYRYQKKLHRVIK